MPVELAEHEENSAIVSYRIVRHGLPAIYKLTQCGAEYILHGGNEALKTLHSIFTRVWEDEVVPEEWHQNIIIPLYKGKWSRSDYSNYRGITLLSVPGKVFAKVILSRIRPTLLAHRRSQQSSFTPGRSTCDHIHNTAQLRQDSTYAAYDDLRATYNQVTTPVSYCPNTASFPVGPHYYYYYYY